jgi:PHD/YefM family antitoxin component YafN of YafNO toxin-antitoxin module
MQLHPEYVTDSAGKRKAVILPVAEYKELLEDLEDLAVIAERREMPTISHQKVKSQLKRDGRL